MKQTVLDDMETAMATTDLQGSRAAGVETENRLSNSLKYQVLIFGDPSVRKVIDYRTMKSMHWSTRYTPSEHPAIFEPAIRTLSKLRVDLKPTINTLDKNDEPNSQDPEDQWYSLRVTGELGDDGRIYAKASVWILCDVKSKVHPINTILKKYDVYDLDAKFSSEAPVRVECGADEMSLMRSWLRHLPFFRSLRKSFDADDTASRSTTSTEDPYDDVDSRD
ncbi:hypothetical protein GGR57DRAFT_518237 [Xylariaceae sp. FL1272]|nr:hypothetical protein GGR57DRAFT_518237 [Xylariaceae sp. FL1272]